MYRITLAAILLGCCASTASAAPYLPKSDEEVLERLPLRADEPARAELTQLRAALAQKPDNVQLAADLARAYIEIGRAEADPRYFGYAQAALKTWWDKPKPPLAVLVLRATLRQSTHRFDEAIADLDQVLRAVPQHPQALLTRATVHQVRGEFAKAKADCAALAAMADELVATACATGPASLTGELAPSYQRLAAALQQAQDAPAGIQAWVATQLAEMAQRLGEPAKAEAHFKQALAQDANDSYLLAAYSDFLLDHERPAEVLRLLQERTRADTLLLRLALAQHALDAAQAKLSVAALQARFDAARRRGDSVHLREEARYELRLLNRPAQALALARQNWQVQKEPADARVLLEAALAANDRTAARELIAWLQHNQLQDAALEKLARSVAVR